MLRRYAVTLPIEPIEEIMKKAGADRIDKKAAKVLADVLADYAEEITEDALALAKHAGRKTITAEDIRLAKKV